MRTAVSRLIVVSVVLAFGFAAAAQAGPLSGHVRDQSGNPIPFATVEVLDPSTGESLASDATTETGSYAIEIDDGTYDVRVTPTSSSGFSPATRSGVVISGPTTLDFSLVAPTATAFIGRVLDLAGVGIPNQAVRLFPEGGEFGQSDTTDSTGTFTFNVQTGSYFLLVNGHNPGLAFEGPQFYDAQTAPFEVTGSLTVDFTLPVKRVTVHVQDSNGAAVAGASLFSTRALNCELMFGGNAACGVSNYDDAFSPHATTDSSGNFTLFLFSTPPGSPETSYSFTATPPAPSTFAAGSVSGVRFDNDTAVTIVLNPATALTVRLLDGSGAGIPNQSLTLVAEGQETGVDGTTDANGEFAFAVPPGTYHLNAFGDNQAASVDAPGAYSLSSGFFSFSASQTIDFQLPVARVDVHVTNTAGTAVAAVGLSTTAVLNCGLSFGPTTACGTSNYGLAESNPITDPSGDVTLWLFPTPPPSPDPNAVASYRFTATPPSGSGLATATESNITFASNTTVNIVLAAPVTVQGQVFDRANQGIANQFLEFVSADTGASTGVTTDAAGNYSANLQPGSYFLNAFGDNQNFTAAAPQFYSLGTGTFTVSTSATQVINLTLPVKRLDVHVQDASDNPIPNVGLTAFGPTNCALTFGPAAACGNSQYFYSRPAPGDPAPAVGVTDASGDMVLWLFPTPAGDPDNYSLTATPLTDSGFREVTVSGITLTDDASLVIVLTASHAGPVTTLDISPAANPDGTYPDPVTITLSATAATGFNVDATFYEVDDTGLQQYGGPFEVTGAGAHVVRYFSVDDDGVSESPNTFEFTIEQADITAPITTATVSPDANAAGWHREDVTVGLNAVDEAGGSGVQHITYMISGAQATPATQVSGNTATISITVEGESVITFWATDNAGNDEAAQTVTVRLDKTAPSIDGAADHAANANGWNNQPVTVTFTCSDSTSGLAAGSPPAATTLSTEGADQSVAGTCTDVAGNSASDTVSGINIDLTSPEAFNRFDPATRDIAVFGRDLLSGVPPGPIAPSQVVPAGPGQELRRYDVVDRAGNTLRVVVQVQRMTRMLLARVVSTEYGNAAPTMTAFNLESFAWTLRADGTLKTLDQVIWAGGSLVQAHFAAGQTTITRWFPVPVVREVRAGLVLLRVATTQDTLAIEY